MCRGGQEVGTRTTRTGRKALSLHDLRVRDSELIPAWARIRIFLFILFPYSRVVSRQEKSFLLLLPMEHLHVSTIRARVSCTQTRTQSKSGAHERERQKPPQLHQIPCLPDPLLRKRPHRLAQLRQLRPPPPPPLPRCVRFRWPHLLVTRGHAHAPHNQENRWKLFERGCNNISRASRRAKREEGNVCKRVKPCCCVSGNNEASLTCSPSPARKKPRHCTVQSSQEYRKRLFFRPTCRSISAVYVLTAA